MSASVHKLSVRRRHVGLSSRAVAADGYRSELARELAPRRASGSSATRGSTRRPTRPRTRSPRTAKQLDLSRLLVDELRRARARDASSTSTGYVLATAAGDGRARRPDDRPARPRRRLVRTSPATNVQPQVIRYEGGRAAAAGRPAHRARPRGEPEARRPRRPRARHERRHDAARRRRQGRRRGDHGRGRLPRSRHPEIEHGPVRICFTRDEEIGRGIDDLDLDALRRRRRLHARRLDRRARSRTRPSPRSRRRVTFRGVAVHPGYAKGRIVNAIKARRRLRRGAAARPLSPETTEEPRGLRPPVARVRETARSSRSS